jgi:membrane protease YdiL (CAAX protease family)
MMISTPRAKLAGCTEATHTTKCSFSLALYLLIVFGLSWPFLIASQLWASDLLWGYWLNSMGMIMVTVGTFLAGKYVFGNGFTDAGWAWGKPQHYLGVLALVFCLWLFPTLIDLATGRLALPSGIQRGEIIRVSMLLLVTLIPGFGEEFGWRGYLIRHLAQRMSPRKTVLLHAIIWWVWHWPAMIGLVIKMVNTSNGTGAPPQSLPAAVTLLLSIGALPTILHGIVFAWIWWHTQSLAVVTVYHAFYDGVRDSLAITIGANTIGSSGLVEVWPTGVICLLGLLLLWKGNWQRWTAQAGESG